MFESLQARLEEAIKRLRGHARITEDNIAEALAEVRRALLDADVHVDVVRRFIQDVKEKAIGTEVKGKILPEQLIVKIIHDELVSLMGTTKSELAHAPTPPTVILVVGLQGSGKTTFAAKLAAHLRKKGQQPLLVAADVYRPAAIEQLKMLAATVNVPVFTMEGSDPVNIAREALHYAKKFARTHVIVDTAGRLAIDEAMMLEVESIRDHIQPREVLFVCDAMIGQDAVTTARTFDERVGLTGVVLSKLDGDARGGAALSIRFVVGKPIKFISNGEKLEALESFHPDRIASRILGMGDIVSFVERAEQEFDEAKAAELEEKIRKREFTFDDFLDQIRMLRKMGSIRELLGMLPGMDKALRNVEIDERAFTKIEAMILSMTPQERRNPRIINGSRRLRIARGSGTTIQDVNRLLKQFEEMQKLMRAVTTGNVKLRNLPAMMSTPWKRS